MTELTIQLPDFEDALPMSELSRLILRRAAIELYEAEKLSSVRAAELAGIAHSLFLKEVGETPPPGLTQSLDGSRYLLRVLWALFEGEKRSMTPMTAAELAKFVSTHSEIKIEETNTARFFRDCRKTGKFEEFWVLDDEKGRRRYTISEEGRGLFLDWLEGSAE